MPKKRTKKTSKQWWEGWGIFKTTEEDFLRIIIEQPRGIIVYNTLEDAVRAGVGLKGGLNGRKIIGVKIIPIE